METSSAEPLHPNLARLAAAYDALVGQYAQGELTADEVNGRIAALVARDDAGLLWSIDPVTAAWRYRTRSGEYRQAQPPTSGVATPTAFDFSQGGAPSASNPDDRVDFYTVDQSLLQGPGSLLGATYTTPPPRRRTWSRRTLYFVVGLLLGVLVIFATHFLAPASTPASPTLPTVASIPAHTPPPTT